VRLIEDARARYTPLPRRWLEGADLGAKRVRTLRHAFITQAGIERGRAAALTARPVTIEQTRSTRQLVKYPRYIDPVTMGAL